ncbi:MAG: hypothetical protein HKN41_04220, partial [Ilumatobacter sp.]|nr:hypothetical protein [Ilumatobacter sp.]
MFHDVVLISSKEFPHMQSRTKVALGLASAIGLLFSSGVAAHDSPNDGHIPANVNYGFEVVGRDTLAGVVDEQYTDVWSHDGYAYIGTFQNPCNDAGVFVVDIDEAIAQYQADGSTEGATVAEIKSAPNTRINDVKVHSVGDVDVLVATQEPCGMNIPGAAQNDSAPGQVGQGGISLYDVSDPTKPKALKKNFLEFEGVHNTFMWDWEGKSYLIGTADTFDFFDTFFVDITKPQSPKLLSITGALDWIPQGVNLDQLETGSSAGIFNHDVWVEVIDGVPTAVVSYWDLGFVTLDVTDPANPAFLMDSTYPAINVSNQPYEGNAHAAVFGGEGDYIFGGDEDFSDSSFSIAYDGVDYPAGVALFGDDPNTLAGNVEYVGGDGCASVAAPTVAEPQVALIDRGGCFFSDKGANAEAAGYEGYIIANNAGDGLINMSAGDNAIPTIPGVFIGQSDGDAIKANQGLPVNASSIYDGWGYLHIINNTDSTITVPDMGMANPSTMDVAPGHHLGYYAPAETVEDSGLGTDFGDLTMHNIEADPLTQDITPGFNEGPRMFVSWYSLGMRAVEYRPGHFHDNSGGEGSYSQNVHEVGRWIDPAGSNFWGVHIDEADV